MADDTSRSFLGSIPIPGLIAVITGVMGAVLLQYQPLKSLRPPDPARNGYLVDKQYEIEASPYEDPLAVIARAEFDTPKPEVPPSEPSQGSVKLHTAETLREEITKKANNGLLVIPAFLRPGSKATESEIRARMRLAVIQGMSASGYVPAGGKLECCRFDSVDETRNQPYRPVGGYFMPVEWFQSTDAMPALEYKGSKPRPQHALVLWLPFEPIDKAPIWNVRKIVGAVIPDTAKPGTLEGVSVRVIGPPTTGALGKLLKEAMGWPAAAPTGNAIPPEQGKGLRDGIWTGPIDLYSQSATAALEGVIAAEFPAASELWAKFPHAKDSTQLLELIMAQSLGKDAVFARTVTTDNFVARTLIEELKRRGIEPPSGEHSEKGDHIVIISEFDSAYGRAFPDTFLCVTANGGVEGKFNRPNSRWHWFNFPAGLDGRAPGSAEDPQPNGKSSAEKSTSETRYKPDEVPHGTNQADTLRRLAEQMENLESELTRNGDSGIRAIGLMGGDVFDKLWLLRALRPRFPGAIFFTNNLDTWLWQKDELPSTRNLVIASPYGLSLGNHLQMGKAPFRDSYQTSAYVATLAVAGTVTPDNFKHVIMQPYIRLYEIGSEGPFDLSSSDNSGHADFQPLPPEPWWNCRRVNGTILIAAAFSVLAALWWSPPQVLRAAEGPSGKRGAALVDHYWLQPVAWLPVIALASCWLAYQLWWLQREGGEPLLLWKGISAWPTEALRIAACLLSVHLGFNLYHKLEKNAEQLKQTFFKHHTFNPSPEKPTSGWAERLSNYWFRAAGKASAGGDPPPPEELWSSYIDRIHWKARLIRSAAVALAIVLVFFILGLLAEPVPIPIRGIFARRTDWLLDGLSTVAFIGITCLVIDTMWTSRMFIFWVTRGMTGWSDQAVTPYVNEDISRDAACDYLDLQLVAERTRPIASFAFYPFYVLALLVISRFESFDRWTWPVDLLAAYLLSIVLLLVAASLLRGEAEGVRKGLICKLEADSSFPPKEESSRVILTKEVKAMRTGALAPISHQPVMKAIYWLISALGAGGLWQYLSRVL